MVLRHRSGGRRTASTSDATSPPAAWLTSTQRRRRPRRPTPARPLPPRSGILRSGETHLGLSDPLTLRIRLQHDGGSTPTAELPLYRIPSEPGYTVSYGGTFHGALVFLDINPNAPRPDGQPGRWSDTSIAIRLNASEVPATELVTGLGFALSFGRADRLYLECPGLLPSDGLTLDIRDHGVDAKSAQILDAGPADGARRARAIPPAVRHAARHRGCRARPRAPERGGGPPAARAAIPLRTRSRRRREGPGRADARCAASASGSSCKCAPGWGCGIVDLEVLVDQVGEDGGDDGSEGRWQADRCW